MIYSIHPDVKNYQWYLLEDSEVCRHLGEDAVFHLDPSPTSYTNSWKTMAVDIYPASGNKQKDFPDLSQRYGRLFLNEKAKEALHPLIESCGELLPVIFKDAAGTEQKGWLLNILTLADHALHPERCLKNDWGDIIWQEFVEDKLPSSALFRTAYDGYMSVFCKEEFVQACQSADLKGIIFSENLAPEPP